MDDQLRKRLTNLSKQNERLYKIRSKFLLKNAERKHFEAKLIRAAEGKSHAERATNAQASEEWLLFQGQLAELESEFEFEKLKYEILDKAYYAEHATYKIEDNRIKFGVED